MTDLKTLIESYFAGELTDEQSRDLSQRLVGSADARRLVWEHAQQEALRSSLSKSRAVMCASFDCSLNRQRRTRQAWLRQKATSLALQASRGRGDCAG